MGRPRKKIKVALRTYNISVENADRLDQLKQSKENQDDVITRLLALGEDSDNYKFLYNDSLETLKYQRRKYTLLQQRYNSLYQISWWMNGMEYLQLPSIF